MGWDDHGEKQQKDVCPTWEKRPMVSLGAEREFDQLLINSLPMARAVLERGSGPQVRIVSHGEKKPSTCSV